jgi:hypothetical protein
MEVVVKSWYFRPPRLLAEVESKDVFLMCIETHFSKTFLPPNHGHEKFDAEFLSKCGTID